MNRYELLRRDFGICQFLFTLYRIVLHIGMKNYLIQCEHDLRFSNFLIFFGIPLSPKVKRYAVISNKNGASRVVEQLKT